MAVAVMTMPRKTNDEPKHFPVQLYTGFAASRITKIQVREATDSSVNEKFMKENRDEEEANKLVCVTSGVSLLGLALVKRLLCSGFSVRIAVDKQEDMETLRQMETIGEAAAPNIMVSAVAVKVTDIESLCAAFDGCHGVFHTSAFVDPAGVSGYSKNTVDVEVKASENVMEACARTKSVRKCVFASSLLACVWHGNQLPNLLPVIDHNCWSEESVCRDKKLWFALGKTMAERAAWRMAEYCDVKLATICSGLLTGPNSMSSIAYLKGAQDMYTDGLLATADVSRVAEAHVCVYKALRNTAHGRYMWFDHVIRTEEDAVRLASEMGVPQQRILGDDPVESPGQFKLCNRKLSRLMSKQSRCS